MPTFTINPVLNRYREVKGKNRIVFINKWNYVIDETEIIPDVKINYQGLPIIE